MHSAGAISLISSLYFVFFHVITHRLRFYFCKLNICWHLFPGTKKSKHLGKWICVLLCCLEDRREVIGSAGKVCLGRLCNIYVGSKPLQQVLKVDLKLSLEKNIEKLRQEARDWYFIMIIKIAMWRVSWGIILKENSRGPNKKGGGDKNPTPPVASTEHRRKETIYLSGKN